MGWCLCLIIAPFFLSTKITNYQNQVDWGFFAHRQINRMATFTLPPEMIVFYKKHIDYLTDHAIDPDKRRYASPHEAVRHYIDLDVYGKAPFDNMPRNWTNALMAYSEFRVVGNRQDTFDLFSTALNPDTLSITDMVFNSESKHILSKDTFRNFFIQNVLPQYYEEQWQIDCDSIAKLLGVPIQSLNCQKIIVEDHLSEHGILPWHLNKTQRNLTSAFLEMDPDWVLRLSADFGHYLADAHVPLHTTKNYNGQLTGQNGIHAFWETRLPELFFENYDLWVGKAEYIERPQQFFWDIILESHAYVDSVLLIEKSLREIVPSDQQNCIEQKGAQMVTLPCREFSKIYHNRMNGMVEERLRKAILAIGSAWYTAWWDAGQPDLRQLLDKDYQNNSVVDSTELEQKFRLGNIFGRKH